jgi:hypothetical protein
VCLTVVILCPHDFILLRRTNGTERQESKYFTVSINNSSELEVYVINATVLQSILSFVCSVGSVKMLLLSVVGIVAFSHCICNHTTELTTSMYFKRLF